MTEKEREIPEQHQNQQPGLESELIPQPASSVEEYRGSGKLKSKVAIVTGGDSGIGRAVAIAFAKEGADIVIAYLNEHSDAHETKQKIEQCGRKCELIDGDVGNQAILSFGKAYGITHLS
ncbi:MAG: SDR family NAD(P)-dependent oxidoreductase, partial [Nitrosospira sp.]